MPINYVLYIKNVGPLPLYFLFSGWPFLKCATFKLLKIFYVCTFLNWYIFQSHCLYCSSAATAEQLK